MACHLLLKNNTVSLSQPVKRKQIQNRENMRDNYFLTYDERQTAFSKNYGYLISTEYWLTFYKYYIVFSTAFIASRVSLLSGEEKSPFTGMYSFFFLLCYLVKQHARPIDDSVPLPDASRMRYMHNHFSLFIHSVISPLCKQNQYRDKETL